MLIARDKLDLNPCIYIQFTNFPSPSGSHDLFRPGEVVASAVIRSLESSC